jgi:hypothetical protein
MITASRANYDAAEDLDPPRGSDEYAADRVARTASSSAW